MREILFRGKRVDNGEWVYGSLLNPYRKKPLIAHYKNGQEILGYTVEVISDTIGQYTGLKDRDGNKIFEGDIICNYHRGQEKYQVIYECGCFMIARPDFDGRLMAVGSLYDILRTAKIIGNVYDSLKQRVKGDEVNK